MFATHWPVLDCAIVGAGVAGLFCARRLSEHDPDSKIAVFEMSTRVGGRLRSVEAKGAGAPAEMGAYSFSDQDAHLFGLARDLKLDLRPLNFAAERHFLRGALLGPDPAEAGTNGSYRVSNTEKGRHPHALLFEALATLSPDIGACLSLMDGDQEILKAGLLRLRDTEVGGRPLSDWGFWNLLAKRLSNEAYELLLATHGAASAFRNANAYEAIALLLREGSAGQKHFRFADGFSALARALAQTCSASTEYLFSHQLISVGRSRAGVLLRFKTPDANYTVECRKLILALPKRALEMIAFEEDLLGDQFYLDLEAVAPVPASKLYLEFDEPWAFEPTPVAAGEHVAAAYTDLPMRQCYQFSSRHAGDRTGGLILASFADDAASSYWSALAAPGASEDCLASPEMIDAACAQLAQLFPGRALPAPVRGLFVDWSQPRYGGAWHAWSPGVRSWEVRERMRRPNLNAPLFICGEAFAQLQGWTEGAINNAEMMLERHFGLARPSWVRGDYAFEF